MTTKNWHKTYNEDCIQGMANHVEDNSIDLIFTDPPYGIDGASLDKHYHRVEKNVVEGYIDVPKEQYNTFSKQWITECARVLRPGGSMYIVSGYTGLVSILNALHSTNLVEVNHLIAEYTFAVNASKKWVSGHYHVLYWSKPPNTKRTFNTNWKFTDSKDSYHDRLSVQNLPRDYKHGAVRNKNQLSETFIEKFIRYSSNADDIILDPFLGGFTTARTALRCKRNIIGFELNENAYNAFNPTLDDITPDEDPVPIEPDKDVLEKREKQRQGWKNDRKRRKEEKANESIKNNKTNWLMDKFEE